MSILIKNVQVVDGTGKPPVKADVLIKKDKISTIENFINYDADEIIEGWGAYLAPGFIDINNRQDRYLNIFPAANSGNNLENFLSQGVTTIMGGSGGISLAPLIYGSLNFLKPWANTKKINVNWHSVSDFIKSIKRIPFKTNFGTLAGFNAIYHNLINGKKITPSTSRILNFILKEALEEGLFGISVDFHDVAIRDLSYFEIKKIASLSKRFNRILCVNLKNDKENLVDSVKKIIYLAKESKAKILINNLFPFVGFETQHKEAMDLIDKFNAHADMSKIYFDIPICDGIVLSVKEISELSGEEIIATSPLIKSIIGKTLREFSDNRGLDLKNGFIKLMEITESRVELEIKKINIQKFLKLLPNKSVLISSNSSLPSLNAFKNFLKIAEEGNIISVEEAIKKITYLPAKILGIEKRGEIKSGYFADLVIFKDGEIKEVILNGKRIVEDKKYNGISAGVPLFLTN